MIKRKAFLLLSGLLLTGCSGTSPILGVKNGKFIRCPNTPNCVNSQIKSEEHFIKPLSFNGNTKEFDLALRSVLNKMGNSKIITSKDDYYRLEFTSSFFRFVDDVEIFIPNKNDEELIIHIRSASRIGHSDMGVNRDRVEKIRILLSSK